MTNAFLKQVESLSINHFRPCGSPVVKVSDHGRDIMSLSPVPLRTRRVGQRRSEICRELKRPIVGVVWLIGEGVPAQVPSTSIYHGSKLRGLSPKALV
ncbi:hypothetical protein TNCV_2467951 [Trichonephila clavipes]|nr:hypothetical protein TNCV_2467951 [Trichonephila clavipes]